MDNATTKPFDFVLEGEVKPGRPGYVQLTAPSPFPLCLTLDYGSVIGMTVAVRDQKGYEDVAISVTYDAPTRCWTHTATFAAKECLETDNVCRNTWPVATLRPRYERRPHMLEVRVNHPPVGPMRTSVCPEVEAEVLFAACESGGDVFDEAQLTQTLSEMGWHGAVYRLDPGGPIGRRCVRTALRGLQPARQVGGGWFTFPFIPPIYSCEPRVEYRRFMPEFDRWYLPPPLTPSQQ